jgi:ATP-dependent RNA helicase DeaD
MPSFDDLGLREELLRTLEDEDIDEPTALQEGVIPALRRGGNVVARTSSGSGKTLAYALGVLDRLRPLPASDEEEDAATALRFVVLTPTLEVAEHVARSMYPYAQAAGFSLSVPGGGWGLPATQAEVLVGPTADLMSAVRGSAMKLESLEAVVVDGASAIVELGDWDAVDTLLDLAPRDAQRVVFSDALPGPVEDLVERRVKRALRYPAEAAIQEGPQAPREGQVGYVLVGGREKVDVLARQLAALRGEGSAPVIFCRTDERAADLAEQLSIRGFLAGAAGDPDADVVVASVGTSREELLEEAGEVGLGQTISFDVPADPARLLARHRGDADAVVLLEPRELPHLREVAGQANLGVRSVPLAADEGVTAQRLNAFRDELRRALREEDLAAQLLVLEPLLEEFSATEVAAAVTALLRSRRPREGAAAATGQRTTAPAAPSRASAETGPAPATWARLYVGVGSRDDIRPGDLVGALAGEAGIQGSKIGKIEIRDSFSIVEVQADLADQVIRAVNGTTIKGRSARVDYDRGGERGARGPRRSDRRPGGPGPGGPPRDGGRRVVRRPPRE